MKQAMPSEKAKSAACYLQFKVDKMQHHYSIILCVVVLIGGCGRDEHAPPKNASPTTESKHSDVTTTLAEARRGFQTKLLRRESSGEPISEPPADLFGIVKYESPVGELSAYLTPDPKDGKKHPAIIWITGGDCNTIGEVWGEVSSDNDQTARAYRDAGIVMMFPSLRGGNDNPGVREGFFGEVDDVVAAAGYLAQQSYVDPNRIYLGGHSTGGTLVLLVAECSDRFRGVFSFGPVDHAGGYGPKYAPYDFNSRREHDLRGPILWLNSIRSPVFIFEGKEEPGNIKDLQAMQQATTNSKVHFIAVSGGDHFNILAPTNELISSKILRDDGPTTTLSITSEEVDGLLSE